MQNQTSDYIFVYGTLRRDHDSNLHQRYLYGADFISAAKVRGQLYMVSEYPGLVLNEREHWALGEIYLLASEAQLHELDVYEGCAKNSPLPHEYQRILIDTQLTSGETLRTWAYIYQQDISGLALIDSGDFLNRY